MKHRAVSLPQLSTFVFHYVHRVRPYQKTKQSHTSACCAEVFGKKALFWVRKNGKFTCYKMLIL